MNDEDVVLVGRGLIVRHVVGAGEDFDVVDHDEFVVHEGRAVVADDRDAGGHQRVIRGLVGRVVAVVGFGDDFDRHPAIFGVDQGGLDAGPVEGIDGDVAVARGGIDEVHNAVVDVDLINSSTSYCYVA